MATKKAKKKVAAKKAARKKPAAKKAAKPKTLGEGAGIKRTPAQVGKGSRDKGQRGEREVAKLLQPHVAELYAHHGREVPKIQRNLSQTQDGGFDLSGLPWFAIEVKNYAEVTTGKLAAWWKQTEKQATGGKTGVLIYRKTRSPWRVRFRTGLQCGAQIVGTDTLVDVSLDDFVAWLKWRIHGELSASLENLQS